MQSLSSLLASWEGERQLSKSVCDHKFEGAYAIVASQLGFFCQFMLSCFILEQAN